MNLSEAYNKKNLIDENWVIDKLKQEWKLVHNGYFWSTDTKLYGKTVWVSLFFGYREDSAQPVAMYYSSFGVNSKNASESFVVVTDHCWGEIQPSALNVIWYYRDRIRASLFPKGLRNRFELII